jgi:hypothetical protein
MATAPNPDLNPGGDAETIDATDASQGQKTGHVRWMLIIGSALAVIGVAVVWAVMGGFH